MFLTVTPLAGVWIEIQDTGSPNAWYSTVTPLAGVWIEIRRTLVNNFLTEGHSPCGSVD